MTPAINLLKKKKVSHQVHTYSHDPNHPSFGLEAAEKLKLAPERVFKTLVASLDDGSLIVAVIPVNRQLNLKSLARESKRKKAAMAATQEVEKATGYLLGGVSPLAQKKRLPLVLDRAAADYATIFVSGGRRGVEIELAADDLVQLTGGRYADLT